MADSTKKIMRELSIDGWSAEMTSGGHIVFRHPNAGPVFTGASPSDQRVVQQLRSQMRRALREGPNKKTTSESKK
jgi:predicted RNA binding protein YcfA (HicA-like mRNA interferase family)